jgi:hypothetical protein
LGGHNSHIFSRMGTIQRFELNAFYHHSVFCPFCGQKVVDQEAAHEGVEDFTSPCEHTLFIAHDEGFEYRSPRFDEDLGIEGVDYFDDDFPEHDGLDTLTDKVTIPDSLKIAAYVGPPSGFGSYVGFAPLSTG